MIDIQNYTPSQVDLLYSIVEEAVLTREEIDFFKIIEFLKPEDFYLFGRGTNGLLFQFNGLKWVDDDGEIYNCLIQPQVRLKSLFPKWYPVITYNDRDRSSSGILSMIKKENRYNKIIEPGWA